MPEVSSYRLASPSDRILGSGQININGDRDQDDEQGEGDVFEDRRGKMPRTTSPVSLQSTLWQGLLFQV